MKNMLLAVFFLMISLNPCMSIAENHYYFVTQTGSGTKNGSNLLNSFSIADFNDSSNWSTNDDKNKIDPGDIVYFSGIIESIIEPAGSGTEGKFITIDGSLASINVDYNSLPGTSGSININARSYLIVQNFKINGLATPHDDMSDTRTGVWIEGYENRPSNHIIIDNCEIKNHGGGIKAFDNAHYISVINNYVHEVYGSGFNAGKYHSWGSTSNMTIGGPKKGNVFKNCGYNSDYSNTGSSPDIELQHSDNSYIGYNHLYTDASWFGWGGVMIEEAKQIIIEYNTVHGHYAANSRGGIVVKEDTPYHVNENIIIRYNNVFDERQSGKPKAWGREKAGIHAGSDVHNIYIYGNYVHDTHWGIRLMENFSGPDGRDNENFYVFANIVSNIEENGIALNGSKDAFRNIYIFNNTIYRSSYSSEFTTGVENTSIASRGMSAFSLYNINIINNVIINSRPNKNDYLDIFWPLDNDATICNNHHYNTGGNPTVYFENTKCLGCDWDSYIVPSIYGTNDTGGDAFLKNLENGDFRIGSSNSKLIDTGKKLGNGIISSVQIQDKVYQVRWDFALDPRKTDWTTIPPQVTVLEQDNFGLSWEKGAYVYIYDDEEALSDKLLPAVENVRIGVN